MSWIGLDPQLGGRREDAVDGDALSRPAGHEISVRCYEGLDVGEVLRGLGGGEHGADDAASCLLQPAILELTFREGRGVGEDRDGGVSLGCETGGYALEGGYGLEPGDEDVLGCVVGNESV